MQTPWTEALQASPSLTISWSLPKFMFIALVITSNYLTLWCLSLLLPLICPSIRDFSNEPSVHIRWPKYWSFSFSIILSNEYLGLISFKITCWAKGFQESTPAPQFESINSFTLCLLYVPTLTSVRDYWKDYSLEYKDLCCKVMSVLLNTLSRFVIAFLSRSNYLLISWLRSLSTVILEPKKRKSVTASTFSPSICHEVMGPDAMILVFLNIEF